MLIVLTIRLGMLVRMLQRRVASNVHPGHQRPHNRRLSTHPNIEWPHMTKLEKFRISASSQFDVAGSGLLDQSVDVAASLLESLRVSFFQAVAGPLPHITQPLQF